MATETERTNYTERLLIQISQDVASIKTDLNNFKDVQKADRELFQKEVKDVRSDCMRELDNVKDSLTNRINSIQTVQNNLVGDVDTLKHAEEKKYAKRWNLTIGFIATAVGGYVLGKLPEIIKLIINIKGN